MEGFEFDEDKSKAILRSTGLTSRPLRSFGKILTFWKFRLKQMVSHAS